MNKQQTIEALKSLKNSFDIEASRISSLSEGREINALFSTDAKQSKFGLVIYNEELRFKELLGSIFFDNLQVYNNSFHEDYKKIYDIFVKDASNPKKIKFNKVEAMDIDRARAYYSDLSQTIKKLDEILDACLRRLTALSEARFVS